MFRIRTITLAFRRVSVCVCLVGFASLQSPWAHTLKASVPCLPLPLHRPSPFLQPLQKNTYHLPCLPLPLHRIPPLPKTTINPNRKALKRIPTACFGNGDSVLYIGFTLSIYQHRQQAQRFQVRDYPSSQAYIRRPKFPLFRRCRQASAYSCYRLPCRLRSACRCLYGR